MSESRAYRARGIVLRARALGEADRIVTFFTLESGKMSAVAKGIRRQKNRLAGKLEFGDEVQMELHRGRNLDVITDAQTTTSRWTALVAPERFEHAALILELLDSLCEEDLALPDVFDLANGALNAIAHSDNAERLLPRFRLRLLDALGVAPPYTECIECTTILGETMWIDAQRGGLICDGCHRHAVALPAITEDDRANLVALSTPRGAGARVAATPAAARASELLIAFHLGRRPRSGGQL